MEKTTLHVPARPVGKNHLSCAGPVEKSPLMCRPDPTRSKNPLSCAGPDRWKNYLSCADPGRAGYGPCPGPCRPLIDINIKKLKQTNKMKHVEVWGLPVKTNFFLFSLLSQTQTTHCFFASLSMMNQQEFFASALGLLIRDN